MRILIGLLLIPLGLLAQITGRNAESEIRRENRLRTESLAANGVDTGTGAFIAEQTLIDLQGLRPLSFTIAYNSLLTSRGGVVGPGWSHEYEAFLDGNPAGVIVVHWDATTENRFRFEDGDYVGIDAANRYDILRRVNQEWRLRLFDGTEYRFNEQGRLTYLANKIDQELLMTYQNDRLVKIAEPFADREIELFYTGGDCQENPFTSLRCPVRLQYISDQADRILYFGYDNSFALKAIPDPVTLAEQRYPGAISSVLLPIPDGDPAGLTVNITIDRHEPIGLLYLRSFLMGHPRPADLEIRITSPSGTVGTLTNARFEPNWNLGGYAVDFFDGEDPFGTWKFQVIDRIAGQSGTLDSYGISFTEPMNRFPISYDGLRQITMIQGPDGERVLSNVYDAQGRVIIQDDGRDDNEIAKFSYAESAGGVITQYTDRIGNTTVFQHDRDYNLLKLTDALGGETSYTYDSNGNRTSFTDALGRTTGYTYDSQGNLTSSTGPTGETMQYEYDSFNDHNLRKVTDALGQETTFEYDNSNNLRAVRDALGNRDTKTYGGNSQLVGSLLQDGAGIGYNYTGGMIANVDHPVSGSSGANHDAIGWLTEVTDGDGFTRKTRYNSRGDIVQRTDPEGNVSRSSYDRHGRKIRTIAPNGGTNHFLYDGNGNIAMVTDALDQVTSYEYDGEDRVVRITDPAGGGRRYEYDALGRLVKETDEIGNSARVEYDAVGNTLATYDAKGVRIESIVYDDRDLPVQTTGPLGSSVRSFFDAGGRLAKIVDALGRETVYEYDKIDRELAAEDPLGRKTARGYLADDATRLLETAAGFGTEFTYDPANRMTRITFPWQRQMRIRYNQRDLVDRTEFPSGKQLDFEYTKNGEVSRIDRSEGPSLLYTYDESDNLTRISNSNGNEVSRYRYDILNRLTLYSDPRGDQIRYSYNQAGLLSEMVYPDGKTVEYSYDASGQMTKVEDWAGRVTRYEYDPNGSITRIDLPNGTRREMSYDDAGQVVSRRDIDAQGSVIVAYAYTYDAAGQVKVESAETGLAPYRQQPAMFSYGQNTLLSSFNGNPVTHDFDGNVTMDGTNAYSYDVNGNLIQVVSSGGAGGSTSLEYDGEDRLIAMGQTRLTINPLPGLSQVLVSRSGSAVTRYVWGVGLIYEETPNGIRVHHYDHRGSTVAISGASGAVVGRISYGPYGEIGDTTGQTDSIFGFHALFGVISSPGGLLHMRFRWYNPELKQFLSSDPVFGDIGEPSTLNMYSFAENNPVSRVDPSGQIWNVIGGALVGAVVGVVVQAATDIVTGKSPQWEDYAAAAIGGLVGGAIVGACLGTCGPAAIVAAGAVSGAADGALGVAAGAVLRGDEPDPNEVLTAALIGGALGGATAGIGGRGAGKAARAATPVPRGIRKLPGKVPVRNAGGKRVRFNKQVTVKRISAHNKGKIATGSGSKTPRNYTFTTREASVANRLASNFAVFNRKTGRVQQLTFSSFANSGRGNRIAANALSKGRFAPSGRHIVMRGARRNVNVGRRNVGGEDLHRRRWAVDLSNAGLPEPNKPNQLGARF